MPVVPVFGPKPDGMTDAQWEDEKQAAKNHLGLVAEAIKSRYRFKEAFMEKFGQAMSLQKEALALQKESNQAMVAANQATVAVVQATSTLAARFATQGEVLMKDYVEEGAILEAARLRALNAGVAAEDDVEEAKMEAEDDAEEVHEDVADDAM